MPGSRTLPPAALRETCRVVRGRVPLWGLHRARLSAGGCGAGLLDEVSSKVAAAAADWDASPGSRVRLTATVSRDGAVSVGVSRRLSSLDVPKGPVAVRVDVAGGPMLPPGGAKPADRSWWDEAQRTARAAGAHQAVLVDAEGRIVDGGTANLWIVEDDVIVTPPAPHAVAGVARALLLREAPQAGIRVLVENLEWERFERAREAFATNALGGAVALRDRGGPVTARVAAIFEAAWRGAV